MPSKQTAQEQAIEASTIHRARLGDADAFTSIVEVYYARCLRFARSMLRFESDAEDVVQEAFVRVYRALPRYEERQRFESWLFHILGNVCRNANGGPRARDIRSLDDTGVVALAVDPTTPATRFEGEWGDQVRRALANVPPYNREIFLLHYIEGFSYDELEAMTGLKRSALKMRVKRACDQLRAALESRDRAYE